MAAAREVFGDDGEPKIHRYYLFGTGKTFGVFAHHFVASDAHDMFHDHPWRWGIAFVLRGGYFEERCDAGGRIRKRRWLGLGRLNLLLPGDFHRVELHAGRPAWTLFVHGSKTRDWGFLDVATRKFRLWSPT